MDYSGAREPGSDIPTWVFLAAEAGLDLPDLGASLPLLAVPLWRPDLALPCTLGAGRIVVLLTGLLFVLDRLSDAAFRVGSAKGEPAVGVRILEALLSPFLFLETEQAGWFLGRMVRFAFRWPAALAFLLALGRWGLVREGVYLLSAAYLLGYVCLLCLVSLIFRMFRPIPRVDYL